MYKIFFVLKCLLVLLLILFTSSNNISSVIYFNSKYIDWSVFWSALSAVATCTAIIYTLKKEIWDKYEKLSGEFQIETYSVKKRVYIAHLTLYNKGRNFISLCFTESKDKKDFIFKNNLPFMKQGTSNSINNPIYIGNECAFQKYIFMQHNNQWHRNILIPPNNKPFELNLYICDGNLHDNFGDKLTLFSENKNQFILKEFKEKKS